MHKFTLGLLLIWTSAASAMVGGPLFCVGNKVTGMTVEAERTAFDVPMSSELGGSGGVQSQRLFLTGSYGLANFVDAQVKFGAADLNFDDFNNGFSPFASDPSLAWGAGVKAGIPFTTKLYWSLRTNRFSLGSGSFSTSRPRYPAANCTLPMMLECSAPSGTTDRSGAITVGMSVFTSATMEAAGTVGFAAK